jgi:hypothetical protein
MDGGIFTRYVGAAQSLLPSDARGVARNPLSGAPHESAASLHATDGVVDSSWTRP